MAAYDVCTGLTSSLVVIGAHPLFVQWSLACILYSERKWLEEFGFSMVHRRDLTDEVTNVSETTSRHSLAGHIWLSPQLQTSYIGKICDNVYFTAN